MKSVIGLLVFLMAMQVFAADLATDMNQVKMRNSEIAALTIWNIVDERLRYEYTYTYNQEKREDINEILTQMNRGFININVWDENDDAVNISGKSPGMCIPPASVVIEDARFKRDVIAFFNRLNRVLFEGSYSGYETITGSCSLNVNESPEIWYQAQLIRYSSSENVSFEGTIRNGKPVSAVQPQIWPMPVDDDPQPQVWPMPVDNDPQPQIWPM